ncbi:ATP-dependent DNA helicase PIF1-like [Venturia canescens]|uniref:ATP-dependent DNA helicase PIF1-like n=1 Tax=Venturia canescens TaxID=32260 RepID=UPI001C9C3BAA|nr:ATP-dependent DNA helicase PIF1-like [Venturia canescens]
MSLAEFSVMYEHMSPNLDDDSQGDYEVYGVGDDNTVRKIIRLKNGMRMKQRQFQYIERELNQVIAQAIALGVNESHGPKELNDNPVERNDQLNAIVEGYEHGLLDVDMQDDSADNAEEPVLTNEQFLECVRSMNIEQKQLFQKISNTIQDDLGKNPMLSDTLKLFFTGGAGCGKTFLLKMIVHQIKTCYAPTVDSLLDAKFVEVCALTGVAARLIHGRTIHNAFSLAIEKGKSSVYRQLNGQKLENLRRRWKHIRWLIIDEISMVSYEILRSVHLRLQELKNNTLLYGGVHVLVFGDIMQLPPVKGNWCFNQPSYYMAEPHLWRYFGLCELTANMRQQNDAPFVDLLNNLRVGEMTMDQYEMLLDRNRVPLENEFADGEAVRIFPTLKLVQAYNDRMMERLASSVRVYTINARDESREAQTYGQRPPNNVVSNDPNNTGGFLSHMKLAIGARVMLRANIRVSEGLVNGAMGVLRGFQWEALRRDQLEDGELPKKVYVEFDDLLVGRSFKDDNGFVGIQLRQLLY